MAKIMKTMDGNEAAAYASYAFTEVAGIYPITPSSPSTNPLKWVLVRLEWVSGTAAATLGEMPTLP